MKLVINLGLLLLGAALGFMSGHYQGEAMIYERVIGNTAGLQPLETIPAELQNRINHLPKTNSKENN